ncbi:hypothetical protein DMENIID0001_057780 [Sergentomyia squamirostris]
MVMSSQYHFTAIHSQQEGVGLTKKLLHWHFCITLLHHLSLLEHIEKGEQLPSTTHGKYFIDIICGIGGNTGATRRAMRGRSDECERVFVRPTKRPSLKRRRPSSWLIPSNNVEHQLLYWLNLSHSPFNLSSPQNYRINS